MRTIHVEVMDIGDEAYLIDDMDYGTVKKMLITGVRVTVEKPLAKPEVTYKVGAWDYFQPGRVFKTAKEAFDAVDAAQAKESSLVAVQAAFEDADCYNTAQ